MGTNYYLVTNTFIGSENVGAPLHEEDVIQKSFNLTSSSPTMKG